LTPALTGFAVKLALVFVGRPEMLSVTELLPPSAVVFTVTDPLDPRLMVSDGAEVESVKSAAVPFTVTLTVVVCVRLELVPVTVTV
jgi:hypothetical protein